MWLNKILILGVGNILKGDDGLGPTFIREFNDRKNMVNNIGRIEAIDVGTGLTPFLVDICMFPEKPSAIIMVDSFIEHNGNNTTPAGEIFELDYSTWEPKPKIVSFEFHKLPPKDLLSQLQNQGVIIRVLVCKIEDIPEDEVRIGISDPVATAIPKICERVEQIVEKLF